MTDHMKAMFANPDVRAAVQQVWEPVIRPILEEQQRILVTNVDNDPTTNNKLSGFCQGYKVLEKFASEKHTSNE